MAHEFSRTRADPGLDDQEMAQLQALLDRIPEPLLPLDISALDGFLCGLLLQPDDIGPERWFRYVCDIEGRALPTGIETDSLHALVLRRHAQLQHAIAARQWFDPWIFELEAPATPSECVLPWVAGFAAAMDRFPALMRMQDPGLLEPLALIYLHFDPEDLEDAEQLLAMIDTIEPPVDLGEAVQDLVRSLMLIADISRPRAAPPARGRARQQR